MLVDEPENEAEWQLLGACEAAHWKFYRPKPADPPSHHLYIPNIAHLSEEELLALLRPFGRVLGICRNTETLHAGDSYVNVTFATVEAADAALRGLDRRVLPQTQGKPLRLFPSVLHKEKKVALAPEVCLSHFSVDALGIPGLHLISEFVTEEEEAELLRETDSRPWERLARRRVQHHGHRFDYAAFRADEEHPLGAFAAPIQAVIDRVHTLAHVEEIVPIDQLTVNEYPPGIGISPHVDTHSAFTGCLISLSLAGTCAMEFRRGEQKRSLFLPRRSLLILEGEARYAWMHFVPHRKLDVTVDGVTHPRSDRRVSVTMRKILRSGVCTCAWPEECDTAVAAARGEDPKLPPLYHRQKREQQQAAKQRKDEAKSAAAGRNGAAPAAQPEQAGGGRGGESGAAHAEASARPQEATPAVELEYVWGVYEAIAPHFSATRFAVWPAVRAFLQSLSQGSAVLDAGCGNGKYLGVPGCEGVRVFGCDISLGLLDVCVGRGHDVVRANVLRLPYRPGAFDAAISIAVLHHVSSLERRRLAVEDVVRMIKPGGRALITVWAAEQEDPKKTIKKWHAIPQQQQQPREGAAAGGGAEGGADGGGSGEDAHREAGPGGAAAEEGTQQEYFVPWHLPFHRAEGAVAAKAATEGQAGPGGSVVVDASKGAVVFSRYYHVFVKGELDELVLSVPEVNIVDSFFDSSNWCVVIERSARGIS